MTEPEAKRDGYIMFNGKLPVSGVYTYSFSLKDKEECKSAVKELKSVGLKAVIIKRHRGFAKSGGDSRAYAQYDLVIYIKQ